MSASASASPPPEPAVVGAPPAPWPWMVLACLILAASGALRVYQERQFDAAAAAVATAAPFPLRDLPRTVGEHWHMQGAEQVLPEQTQQIAGCSDYIARTYVDGRTGVTLSALVAFGPAERVFPHDPTVCFPAVGYRLAAGPRSRALRRPSGAAAGCEALVYTKPAGGGADELVEVYYTFRHAGRWSAHAEGTSRQFRHRPAMFKLQVQRPIGAGELRASTSPVEDFLAAMIAEIDRRLDAAGGPAA